MTTAPAQDERITLDDLKALREECIRNIVAAAPLLTGDLRNTVRAILNPGAPPTARSGPGA